MVYAHKTNHMINTILSFIESSYRIHPEFGRVHQRLLNREVRVDQIVFNKDVYAYM